MMQYSSSIDLPVGVAAVLPFVNNLSKYPEWMSLVHSVQPDGDAYWNVELRAKVGVFARSKRIRMSRTVNTETDVVFERSERDGGQHSMWKLAIAIEGCATQSTVTMDLQYGGSLWTAGVLDRVLASQVEAGKAGLLKAVQGA